VRLADYFVFMNTQRFLVKHSVLVHHWEACVRASC
jgi:hypothetical protein